MSSLADIVAKVFLGVERKFLETLMRFTRGDVRDHIVSSKSITDLRSGAKERRSRREAQRSTLRDFFGLFEFRLLQQYRPGPDIDPKPESSRLCFDMLTRLSTLELS